MQGTNPFSVVYFSVSDGGHQRVLRLGDVQTGALHDDGAVRFHQNGVGNLPRNGDSLVVDLLVQADVVGALVTAGGVKAAERLPILKIEGQINVV